MPEAPRLGYRAALVSRRLLAAPLLVIVVGASACPPPRRHGPGDGVVASGSDSFPHDFTPPPPLPPPDPPDPAAFGVSYLEQMQPRLQAGWNQFLEDCRLRLPPGHPLNEPTLEATMTLAIDEHGAISQADLSRPSGNPEFDEVVQAVASDAAPFPAPEMGLRSDDDHVYVTWLFARDRRQAGAATASLRRVEWTLELAVPKFLDSGNLAEAARRIARQSGATPPPATLALAERVMIAAVREGLVNADAAVQRQAVTAAGLATIKPAARELRAIADGALDVNLRGAAIDALAAIGDVDAVPLLRTILERDAGANVELTGAAAHALVALGARDLVASVVAGWLAEGKAGKTPPQKARTWAALIAAGSAPVPKAITDFGRLVGSGEPRVRGAACRALAAAALVDSSAWKPLARGLDDPDASARSQCTAAIADAAGKGGRSKATFWLIAPLLRHRDERVRAAAVLALIRLDAGAGAAQLVALAKEKSPLVLAALAEAWVRTGELDRSAALLGHEAAAVRLAAATALVGLGGEAGRAKVAAHTDSDPLVRLVVVGALTDRAALTSAAADPDPGVAAAAVRRQILLDGRGPTLAATATALAAAPAGSALRVNLASAWLAAK